MYPVYLNSEKVLPVMNTIYYNIEIKKLFSNTDILNGEQYSKYLLCL